MNRYKNLLKNTGLVSLGTFGSKLLPFLLMRLYTAALDSTQYNTADLITQTAKLLIPCAALGLTEGFFRLAMEKGGKKKEIFTAGCVIFGGGYLLMLPCLLVAYIVMKIAGVAFSSYLWLIGLYVLTACLHSLATQYIRTKDHFAFFSLQGVINTVLVAVLNIIFYAVGHFGVNEYVLSVVLADFLVTILVVVKEKLWRDLVNPVKIDRQVYKSMICYSAPLIPMAISWWITAVSDRYMVTWLVDSSTAGYYGAAYKFPTLVTLLCTVFSQAWNYSSVAEDDEKERSKFFSGVFAFYLCLLFVMASVIVAFSRLLSAAMLDPAYYGAWVYMPVLTGATVFSALVTFMGSVYTVRMKSMFSMWTAVVGAVLNIVLNLLLIPERLGAVKLFGMGAMGAAVATLISYAAVFLLRAVTARRYVRFNLRPYLLGLNSLLLFLQILAMTLSDDMPTVISVLLQIFFLAAFLFVDGGILRKRVLKILKKKGFFKKKKSYKNKSITGKSVK